MEKSIAPLLRLCAIIGNIVFILWITYNGIDEGFKGTRLQVVSYIGLVTLLVINIILLIPKRENKQFKSDENN